MAEPVSALPNTIPPTTTAKGQTVPWPKPAEAVEASPEISGSNTETAVPELSERDSTGLQDYYSRIQTAVSGMLEASRRRFRYMVEERPMQIVAGVAIASLLAGVALRIWRSHHD